MKTLAYVAVVAAWLAVGCHSTPVQPADAGPGMSAAPSEAVEAPQRRATHIAMSGPAGSPIMGYYIQDGQRVEISGAIPWTLEAEGISALRIVKVNQPDTLVADVKYYKDGAPVTSRYTLGPAVRSIRIKVGATLDTMSAGMAAPMAHAN